MSQLLQNMKQFQATVCSRLDVLEPKKMLDRHNTAPVPTTSVEEHPTAQSSKCHQETTSREPTPYQEATPEIKKGEISVFRRENPEGWIRCTKRFFKLNQVDDREQLKMVMMKLESTALNRYPWRVDWYPF